MNLNLIVSVASSLMFARLKQTLVAAIGVTFSIMMFITLLSFMTGLNDMLDNLILNRTPHIRLYNEVMPNPNQPIDISSEFKNKQNFIHSVKSTGSRKELYNSGAIQQTLKNDSRVRGISPKVNTPVFYNAGEVEITAIMNGIDVEAEVNYFYFGDYITEGNYQDLKNISNSVILGMALAEKLLVNTGDMVYITTSQGESFALKVVGLFQSGFNELDKSQSFASLATTQKILGKSGNYITDIQIKLWDYNQAPNISKEYSHLFACESEDIQTANAQFETGTTVRNIISYAVGITLLVVAGFGIYNILNMMIFEKMESIAILKATGFSGKDVRNIFMVIAMSIGFLGGLLGLFFGFLMSAGIDMIPFNTASLPTVTTYPINYDPKFYLIAGLFSLVTTYLAGYFPSQKASKVDPVVIIRGK